MVTDVFYHFLIIGKETINMKIKQKKPRYLHVYVVNVIHRLLP